MSIKQKWVMANWKMNGTQDMVEKYIEGLNSHHVALNKTKVIVFPPAIYLREFRNGLRTDHYAYGGQNVHSAENGAYTGELSASMLREQGCQYVLVGHSERRHLFGEDNNFIAKKFHIVKSHGMIPVICIGETLEQYQSGQTKAVLTQQIASLNINNDFLFKPCIIAYEPVWAIGTGLRPSNEELEKTFKDIKDIITNLDAHLADIPMLYGGSVTADNIKSIMGIGACQGVLVGGASLDIKQMLEIIECITYC